MQNARLARLEQGRVTMVFPVAGKSLVIGRDLESDILVNDRRASKKHATVSLHGGRLLVEDLNSSNGTYVNGRKADARVLTPGDVIRIGRAVFIYLAEGMPPARSTGKVDGWLIGRTAAGSGLKAPVSETPLLIGRAQEADLRVTDAGVADFHAQVIVAPGGAEVTDLQEDPRRRRTLTDGDELKIGTVVLKYLARAGVAADRAVPEPAAPSGADVIHSLEAEARRVEATDNSVAASSAAASSWRMPKACKLWIAVRNGPLAGQDFEFIGKRMLIGWDRKAKIRLLDDRVSRFHACIRRQEGDVIIEDLDSETGVFVNGTAVRRGTLKSGDLIHIGATDFLVHL